MPISKKSKKVEKLNSGNAMRVANTGLNAAYSQAHAPLVKNPETGKYEEQGTYSQSAKGRMSENGSTRAGGKTWTFTPKNDDGSAVLGKNGKPRQSGRSQMATRRQRYYDVRVGLGLQGG